MKRRDETRQIIKMVVSMHCLKLAFLQLVIPPRPFFSISIFHSVSFPSARLISSLSKLFQWIWGVSGCHSLRANEIFCLFFVTRAIGNVRGRKTVSRHGLLYFRSLLVDAIDAIKISKWLMLSCLRECATQYSYECSVRVLSTYSSTSTRTDYSVLKELVIITVRVECVLKLNLYR